MKKDITVFSLSALDLFCSAMGVFMILCFIVFPYYMKETPAPPTPVEPAPAPPTPDEPPPVIEPPQPEQVPETVPSVTAAIYWECRLTEGGWACPALHDVDLCVDAPGPNGGRLKYHCFAREHAGSPALILVDSMRGGGEAWMHPNVTEGSYKVGFKVASLTQNEISHKYNGLRVKLTIITPNGTKEFPPVELTGSQYKASQTLHHLAGFNVDSEGNITLSSN